jgi:hypothetical protein
MLLPDNIHPELCIYYNGSLMLRELKESRAQSIMSLYQKMKTANNMSIMVFMLNLDWLYLIDAAKVTENGWVELCL